MNRDSRIVEIEMEKIVPNRFQPRKTFNDDISELAESIRAHGVLQPITVRPLGEKYEIVMGERRYRACEKLGMHKIPCMIVEMNDRETMEVALIENLQRQDLSPIEEALSYKRILEAGYITQDQLAQKLGKNQSTIANKLRLLSLDKEVQAALLKNEISERHARALLSVSDKEIQKKLLQKIVTEKMTVKKTEEEIRKVEKGMYEDRNKAQSVEIIDFDDNPFRDPTPEVQPAVPQNESVEQPAMVEELPIDSGDYMADTMVQSQSYANDFVDPTPNDEYDYKTNRVDLSASKNKSTIPTADIIDDFRDASHQVQIESNHGFDNNFNEESETVSLNNVEPDKIEMPEPVQDKTPEKVESFDDMIQKAPIGANNFEQVKAIIDKCQSDLNALGYKVSYEKFDFETMYQIIFKINKN